MDVLSFFNFLLCCDSLTHCVQHFFPKYKINVNICVDKGHLWFHVFCQVMTFVGFLLTFLSGVGFLGLTCVWPSKALWH